MIYSIWHFMTYYSYIYYFILCIRNIKSYICIALVEKTFQVYP